nr:integrase arm-type DNA-binding domain-containing protein [Sphingomonas sp. Y57]
MPLTDKACRDAKKKDAPYKLADSAGLYLYVTAAGARSWRFKYRFAGKEKRLTFGLYPEVSLAEARDRRDAARRQLREHRDPAIEKIKAIAEAIDAADATYETVGRRWHAAQAGRLEPRYHALIIRALERDIFPKFGKLPIREVTGPVVLAALRTIVRRGSIETAHRIRQYVSAVFVFGMAEGLCDADVAATLGKALPKAPPPQKYPAITDLGALRTFLRAFEAARDVGPVVRFANRMLALTAVRPGVLASAQWSEIEGVDWTGDFIGPLRPLWRISAERMKLESDKKADEAFDHVLVLSWQAVAALKRLRHVTGRSPFLFPSARGWKRPISGDALRMAYRRLGYGDEHVPHGWRAAFSTIMNARAKAAVKGGDASRANDRQIIDLMLAHVPEGMSASELRYNRAEHLGEYGRIAQEWADALLAGAKSAEELVFID